MDVQTVEAWLMSVQKEGTRLVRTRYQPIVCYIGQESGFLNLLS